MADRTVTSRSRTGSASAAATRALLASIVENSQDAIIGKSLDGTLTAWNRAAERLFGYAAAEAIGQNVRLLIPADRHSEEDEILATLSRGETVQNYASKRLTKDGRLLDVSLTVSPIRDGRGRVIGASKIVRDVTRQKAAEDALRASAARFRQLADALPVIVWEADAAGRTTYYNHHWYRLTGTEEAAALSADPPLWQVVLHPEDLPNVVSRWDRAVRGGRPHTVEARFLDAASGQYRWHLVRATPARDADGGIVGWFGTSTDIDDLRRAEAERQRMQRQSAEQQAALAHLDRVRSMGQVAAGLAHELNQPLGAIVNYGEVLKLLLAPDARPVPGVDAAGLVVDIMAQAARAGEIIRRLRGFVKKQLPRPCPHDINAVVCEAINLIAFDLRRAEMAVELDLPAGLPEVNIDAVQVQQVLINLVRNAMEAMAGTTTRRLRISSTLEDAGVVVRVADRGCGFPPEQATRLFDSFYTTKPNGLGIGLALCRTILEEHGGSLKADANPGGGSIFSFRLPPATPAGRRTHDRGQR